MKSSLNQSPHSLIISRVLQKGHSGRLVMRYRNGWIESEKSNSAHRPSELEDGRFSGVLSLISVVEVMQGPL